MEGTLTEALCAAQSKMQNPKKNKTANVGRYRYSYATLDTVLDIIRPALNEQGVFLFQSSESVEGGLILHTRVAKGGETLELDATPYQFDTNPQEFGKRETYARRYSLLKAFGLAGDDDTDGDTGEGGTNPPKNPTNHPLGHTAGNEKKKYITRCLQLKSQCMQQGVKETGLDSWYKAKFGEAKPADLTLEQLTEWGQYLAQMAKDSNHEEEQ